MRRSSVIKQVQKVFILIIAVMAALVPAEIFLRIKYPQGAFASAIFLEHMRNFKAGEVFTIDPEFGFRPILGNQIYNKYGTRVNAYNINKRYGVKRLLFIGDSVTVQGKIINALKHFYKEDRFEYWNAGVGSFNTVQEVNFYKKYNSGIDPDHVILTFHINDLETTPVVFADKRNKLIIYAPDIPSRYVNKLLFRNSYLYRLCVGLSINIKGRHKAKEALAREIRMKLAELRDILRRDNIEFTVIFHPTLLAFDRWPSLEKEIRTKVLSIFRELNIKYYDLTVVLDDAVRDNIDMTMHKQDLFHPSDDMARYFAEYLFENSILTEE